MTSVCLFTQEKDFSFIFTDLVPRWRMGLLDAGACTF